MEAIDGTSSSPAQAKDGTLTRLVKRILLTNAEVATTRRVSEHFRLITLHGEELKKATWTPGDKIQVNMGSGFNNRTYTPIHWDREGGQTQVLVYLHGDSPGCQWARDARSQQAVRFLGPRASLDLPSIAESVVLFGDETSIGLVVALRHTLRGDTAPCVVEATNALETIAVLTAFGVRDAIVVERTADGSHLTDVFSALRDAAILDSVFILTGNAKSIQPIKKALTAFGIGNTRQKAKAYWAQGKVGLD